VDLHGAIVLRGARCVKKMASVVADVSRNLPFKPNAKVRNPRSDPLRRRDSAARRSPMAESEMQIPGQTRFFLHRFVFRLGISGFFRV
jgi:hypothetical protein